MNEADNYYKEKELHHSNDANHLIYCIEIMNNTLKSKFLQKSITKKQTKIIRAGTKSLSQEGDKEGFSTLL